MRKAIAGLPYGCYINPNTGALVLSPHSYLILASILWLSSLKPDDEIVLTGENRYPRGGGYTNSTTHSVMYDKLINGPNIPDNPIWKCHETHNNTYLQMRYLARYEGAVHLVGHAFHCDRIRDLATGFGMQFTLSSVEQLLGEDGRHAPLMEKIRQHPKMIEKAEKETTLRKIFKHDFGGILQRTMTALNGARAPILTWKDLGMYPPD